VKKLMTKQMLSYIAKILPIYLVFVMLPGVVTADPMLYRINPGDVLQIFVWNEADLTSEMIVQPDGLIRFPMVGQVMAGGHSPAEVEVQIVSGLRKYLKDEPVVTASLLSIQGNKIYVLGNVARPGEYVVSRRIDVMQALALAGGLTPFAVENDVRILRRNQSGDASSVKFPYSRVKQGEKLETNVILQSGDTVIVP
jgi:polysaccharide biosynthesis/export protein